MTEPIAYYKCNSPECGRTKEFVMIAGDPLPSLPCDSPSCNGMYTLRMVAKEK